MDPQSIVQKLEEAAKILLAPPNLVTGEQRQQAEHVFLEFRKFSFPYETCRFVLEHSKSDYTQFQAAATIKSSIVKEWATLPPQDVEQLRLFLLQYVTSHLTLQAYVREEIFQTLAVIVKRGMLESDAIAKDKIFNEVTQLISTGDLSMQLIACSLLSALLNEFSSYTKSAGTGFTWEFHIRCKRHFEDSHLLHTMVFTLQVLNELAKCDTPFNRTQVPVMMRFLSIAEEILSWEFLPIRLTRRHMVPFGALNQSPLRPPVSWRQTICSPELVHLFFNLYSKVHYNSELSHHALQCLCQLASLNGVVFGDKEQQLTYLTLYLADFSKTLKGMEMQGYDAIGISNIYENLLRWFSIELYAELPTNLLDPFISHMTTLTCTYVTAAKASDSPGNDDNVYIEALEKMLLSWTSLLVGADDHFARGQFKKQATEIFNTYVQCHITNMSAGSNFCPAVDEEEYEEEDIPDKEKFSEHLASVGILGREVTEHSLPTLARLIDERGEKLKLYLERQHERVKSCVSTDSSSQHLLNSLFEDLHWLLLIAASVLTDDVQGESSLIPTHILKHSISQANHIDTQQTQNLITKPELCSGQASQTNKVDNVIRLVSTILRLFYIQSIAVQNNLGSILSPQLDSTAMYFMKRFVDAYLTPSEQNYAEMSITLQTTLGNDTEGSVRFMNVLIGKLQLNLSLWNSESEVVQESLDMLVCMAYRTPRCEKLIECHNFWTFMSLVSENSFPFNSLPATHRRPLYKAIVYCGSCMREGKQQFWEKMVRKPLVDMCQLIADPTFRQRKDDLVLKEKLIRSLETLIGCCEGVRLSNHSELFDIVEPSLQATISLLDVCHNDQQVVELCLEVFCEVISSMICCLDSSSSERLYEQCLAAIHMYAKYSSGQRTVTAESEENKFRDILLILKLLTNLMSKDLIDFGLDERGEVMSVSGTEVVLFGLTVLIPIMDTSLLQFPSLCANYYRLLAFTSEIRPDKVLELPDNLLNLVLSSIHLSLNSFGSDVAKSSFEFLTEMSMYIVSKKSPQLVSKAKLDRFLQPILNMLLFELFEVDLCDIICGCLYYLIILYPSEYQRLVSLIIKQQEGQSHHQLLVKSFQALNLSSTATTRQQKIQFIDNMNKFLLDVKGFLCVL